MSPIRYKPGDESFHDSSIGPRDSRWDKNTQVLPFSEYIQLQSDLQVEILGEKSCRSPTTVVQVQHSLTFFWDFLLHSRYSRIIRYRSTLLLIGFTHYLLPNVTRTMASKLALHFLPNTAWMWKFSIVSPLPLLLFVGHHNAFYLTCYSRWQLSSLTRRVMSWASLANTLFAMDTVNGNAFHCLL